MDLNEIVAVTGKPGLYKVIARTTKGIVLENLEDPKIKMPVNANNQVAVLGEITVYSNSENDIKLSDVFQKMYEGVSKELRIPDPKDEPNKIKTFFQEV